MSKYKVPTGAASNDKVGERFEDAIVAWINTTSHNCKAARVPGTGPVDIVIYSIKTGLLFAIGQCKYSRASSKNTNKVGGEERKGLVKLAENGA